MKLSQVLTAPNQLTLLRMIFVPFIIIHLVDGRYLWALIVFVVAGFSDGLDGLLESNPPGDTFFFFSLSSHRDDPGQWTEYGGNGTGFSIGFSPALFQPDQATLLPRANENVFVSRILIIKVILEHGSRNHLKRRHC